MKQKPLTPLRKTALDHVDPDRRSFLTTLLAAAAGIPFISAFDLAAHERPAARNSAATHPSGSSKGKNVGKYAQTKRQGAYLKHEFGHKEGRAGFSDLSTQRAGRSAKSTPRFNRAARGPNTGTRQSGAVKGENLNSFQWKGANGGSRQSVKNAWPGSVETKQSVGWSWKGTNGGTKQSSTVKSNIEVNSFQWKGKNPGTGQSSVLKFDGLKGANAGTQKPNAGKTGNLKLGGIQGESKTSQAGAGKSGSQIKSDESISLNYGKTKTADSSRQKGSNAAGKNPQSIHMQYGPSKSPTPPKNQ